MKNIENRQPCPLLQTHTVFVHSLHLVLKRLNKRSKFFFELKFIRYLSDSLMYTSSVREAIQSLTGLVMVADL